MISGTEYMHLFLNISENEACTSGILFPFVPLVLVLCIKKERLSTLTIGEKRNRRIIRRAKVILPTGKSRDCLRVLTKPTTNLTYIILLDSLK